MRYEATGSFRRSDFGITYGRGIVGNDVYNNARRAC
jgi:polyisoprenoid-binding protein YceI